MEKPPIGLIPRWLHRDNRFIEVCGAIVRYYDAGIKIPLKWVEEYNDLIGESQKGKQQQIYNE